MIAAGYRPIPITAPGGAIYTRKDGTPSFKPEHMGKVPGIYLPREKAWCGLKDWREKAFTLPEMQAWKKETLKHGAGIGLVCGKQPDSEDWLIALDADVLDEAASKMVLSVIEHRFPGCPLRYGRAPKFIVPMRFTGALPTKRTFKFTQGANAALIEVLGEGQQFVALGTHPVTQKPYRWERPPVPFNELPVIDAAGLDALCKDISEALEAIDYAPVRVADAAVASLKFDGTIPASKVEEALSHVSLTLDYDDWLKVGAACYAAAGDEGIEAWVAWSDRSHKNNGDFTESKIAEVKKLPKVGVGTLVHFARDGGWTGSFKRDLSVGGAEALHARIANALGKYLDKGTPVDQFIDDERIALAVGTMMHSATSNRNLCVTARGVLELNQKDFAGFAHELLGGSLLMRRDELGDLVKAKAERDYRGPDDKKAAHVAGRVHAAKHCDLSALMDHLKLHAQVKSLALSVDIFATAPTLVMKDGVGEVTLPHRPLALRGDDPQAHARAAEVGADFAQHWPEFQNFLEFVAASRFAADRRRCFVWLHCPSDWGKGLLTAAMEEGGLVFNMSLGLVEKALDGGTVGLDPLTALRAWVMHVDEFNAARRELKELNNSITVSAKWQMQTRVPLYTKLFSSAEDVASLIAEGVEKQFENRFAYLRGDDDAFIDDRALMQRLGNGAYMRALGAYIVQVMNTRVEQYRAPGREAAERRAAEYIATTHAEHGLAADFGNIDESLEEVADEIKALLLAQVGAEDGSPADFGSSRAGYEFRKLSAAMQASIKGKRWGKTMEGEPMPEPLLLVRNPDNLVRLYLDTVKASATAKKLGYRAREIAKMLQSPRVWFDRQGRFRVFPTAECDGTGTRERGIVLDWPRKA